jgi:PAS domain S-box-containing protein
MASSPPRLNRQFDSLPVGFPTLSDITDRHPLTVAPATPVAEVLARMSGVWGDGDLSGNPTPDTQLFRNFVLVTEGLKPVGVFAARDAVRLAAVGKNIAGLAIAEVMSEPAHILQQEDFWDVFAVISLFEQKQICCLPVVDNLGNLVGAIDPFSLGCAPPPANLLKLRTVEEVMDAGFACAPADADLLSLAQLMAERDVSFVVIYQHNAGGTLGEGGGGQARRLSYGGIVTEREIVRCLVLELDMAGTTAAGVMSQLVLCFSPSDSLWVAQQEMQRRQVRQLAVTGASRELLGILSQTSWLRLLEPVEMYRSVEILQQQVGKLEGEKKELLQSRNAEVEKLVQLRTAELQLQAERERLLNATALRIRQSLNLQDIFDSTVREVRQLLNCDRVLVYQFEPDWTGTIIAESVAGFPSVLGTKIRDTYFQETKGCDYLQGRRQVTEDIYQAGLTPCHLQLLERLHVRAIIAVPVLINEQLWGLLVAHQCAHPRQWHQEELDLLEKLSVQIAIAIQQARAWQQVQTELEERQRAEAALQQLNEQLEMRVRERTAELDKIVEELHRQIAERQQAEQALQEANGKLNNILESITEGFFALDRQWNFTHFNSLLEPVLQRPVSELLGKNIWEEFPEVIGTPFERAYRQAAAEQKPVSFEEFYPPLNIWFEVRVYPSADGLSVYFRDITHRVQTEEALRYSEERFRIALKNSPIVVFNQDTELRYTWIYNPALGFDASQVVGKFESDLFLLEDAQKIAAIKREVLRTGVGTRQEVVIGYNDDIKCYELSVEPLRNADGEIEGVTCAALDITPRKKAEQALEESQRFIQQIADATPNILYIYDLAEKRNIYSNREVAKILGYTPEEILEMGSGFVQNFVHPDDLVRISNEHERFATAKDGDILESEYRMRNALGEWRWLYSWDTVFARTADGTPKQILGTASDITALKQAEEALRHNNEILAATNAELARATRLKDEFLASMSHELRTPLNAILGMSEGLLEELCGTLNERQRKALSTIEKSGKHLLDLINEILDLAKIEAGKLQLQIAPVGVSSLVESSLTFVKQQAYQKNIKISTRIPEGLPEIEVDDRRMRQVLINLLSNAIKFTWEGGSVTVEVEMDAEEQLVRFSVSDTGIGIAPENMGKLFQPFVQIDSSLSRRYQGTGLGLALVRRIVELHEGGVSFESEVGKGSRFTVALSAIRQKTALSTDLPLPVTGCQLPAVSDAQLAESGEFSPDSPLILLAEDNEANIETISNYLLSAGYRLVLAKNGREAINMAQQHKPSLILMDIQIPEMDGLSVTSQIRSHTDTATIPIIALTALAMPGDREKCLAAGADAYMIKPVSFKQLVKTLKDLLVNK